ncbi:uncharacterized protein BXIN_0939 [Babesia sp. Xinjiang]|uniref:uncharacterized protein n=1 Tax=Babesia sp. Xinjiang TaxID=462227 RepID=UPI000A244762|nr:uncharacterized protein BXIN_0939 [Babesia sp. Xinjiang]ORM42065.1 hypothetical protein BXIN_0939 [Babesia sp. Xinjiang]
MSTQAKQMNTMYLKPSELPDDDPWVKLMKKNPGFKKAIQISHMVGGVYKTEDEADKYIVYSNSENCREVDMLFFNCNCPSQRVTCSHIMAAAIANNNETDYIAKVAIMGELDMKIVDIVNRNRGNTSRISVPKIVANNFFKLETNERTIKILLEMLTGVIYRLMQSDFKGPYKDIFNATVSDNDNKMENIDLKGANTLPCQLLRASDEANQNLHQRLKENDFSFNKQHVDYFSYGKGEYYDTDDPYFHEGNYVGCDELHFAVARIFRRFEYLIQSIGRILKPPEGLPLREAVKLLKPIATQILEEEYGIDWLLPNENKDIEETLKFLMKSYNYENENSYIVDGYALGFDYLTEQKIPATIQYDELTKSGTKEIFEKQIIELPMMADIYRDTNWAGKYQHCCGTLKHMLKTCQLNIDDKMMLITLNDHSVIKVPTTKKFEKPADIVKEMRRAIDQDDPRSFTAHGLTLLIFVKRIALLPSKTELTNAINTMFHAGERGPKFVAECINLLPDMLVVPFFKAYFDYTLALTKESFEKIAFIMSQNIKKGCMTPLVRDRMLRIELYFQITVEEEWEESSKKHLETDATEDADVCKGKQMAIKLEGGVGSAKLDDESASLFIKREDEIEGVIALANPFIAPKQTLSNDFHSRLNVIKLKQNAMKLITSQSSLSCTTVDNASDRNASVDTATQDSTQAEKGMLDDVKGLGRELNLSEKDIRHSCAICTPGNIALNEDTLLCKKEESQITKVDADSGMQKVSDNTSFIEVKSYSHAENVKQNDLAPVENRYEVDTTQGVTQPSHSFIDCQKKVDSITLEETHDNGNTLRVHYDGTECYHHNKKPLSYMLVLSNEFVDLVASVSVHETIDASKYVSPMNMRKKLKCHTNNGKTLDTERNKMVGYLGEEYVYELLQVLLREELKENKLTVFWVNKHNESGQAYDLYLRNIKGEEVFIEVKSSSSNTKSNFEVSYKEWCFAQQKGARYEIFRVSGVGHDTVQVSRLVNPYSMWRSGYLGFCLSL